MKSALYEYRKMSARSGAQFVPIGMPTVCWKTFPAKTTKLKHLDDVVFRLLVFRIRVRLHKICFFMPHYQIFVSTVTVFENEGVSDDTGESVFQFLVRFGCIKSGKIKRLDACYMVESWRLKMF